MKKQRNKFKVEDVLSYRLHGINQSTVKRYYAKWRKEQGIPPRCDNPDCHFHTYPPVWNGKDLPFILDHIDGNRRDNRPQMLRYLYPNCDSQLPTRGGGNKGRVKQLTENSFILEYDGHREYNYFSSGGIKLGGSASVSFYSAEQPAQQSISADIEKQRG